MGTGTSTFLCVFSLFMREKGFQVHRSVAGIITLLKSSEAGAPF